MHTRDVVKMQNNKNKFSRAHWETFWYPWSFPKVTCDIRCASKWIHWYQTSTNCFSNRIRQIYRYTLHCKKEL